MVFWGIFWMYIRIFPSLGQHQMKTMGLITALFFVVGLTGALAQFPPGGFGETRYVDANTKQVVLSVGVFK